MSNAWHRRECTVCTPTSEHPAHYSIYHQDQKCSRSNPTFDSKALPSVNSRNCLKISVCSENLHQKSKPPRRNLDTCNQFAPKAANAHTASLTLADNKKGKSTKSQKSQTKRKLNQDGTRLSNIYVNVCRTEFPRTLRYTLAKTRKWIPLKLFIVFSTLKYIVVL